MLIVKLKLFRYDNYRIWIFFKIFRKFFFFTQQNTHALVKNMLNHVIQLLKKLLILCKHPSVQIALCASHNMMNKRKKHFCISSSKKAWFFNRSRMVVGLFEFFLSTTGDSVNLTHIFSMIKRYFCLFFINFLILILKHFPMFVDELLIL